MTERTFDIDEWLACALARIDAAVSSGEMSRAQAEAMRVRAPGQTERRFMHIEPYWRGREDAPIAVRPHIL